MKQIKLKKLFLDDIRVPQTEGWEIVRSYDNFVKWIEEKGIPDVISFDHDLADVDDLTKEKTGYDAAKWLCEYCWMNGVPLPDYNVHSANPVGRDNINQLLSSYKKKLNF